MARVQCPATHKPLPEASTPSRLSPTRALSSQRYISLSRVRAFGRSVLSDSGLKTANVYGYMDLMRTSLLHAFASVNGGMIGGRGLLTFCYCSRLQLRLTIFVFFLMKMVDLKLFLHLI